MQESKCLIKSIIRIKIHFLGEGGVGIGVSSLWEDNPASSHPSRMLWYRGDLNCDVLDELDELEDVFWIGERVRGIFSRLGSDIWEGDNILLGDIIFSDDEYDFTSGVSDGSLIIS